MGSSLFIFIRRVVYNVQQQVHRLYWNLMPDRYDSWLHSDSCWGGNGNCWDSKIACRSSVISNKRKSLGEILGFYIFKEESCSNEFHLTMVFRHFGLREEANDMLPTTHSVMPLEGLFL